MVHPELTAIGWHVNGSPRGDGLVAALLLLLEPPRLELKDDGPAGLTSTSVREEPVCAWSEALVTPAKVFVAMPVECEVIAALSPGTVAV